MVILIILCCLLISGFLGLVIYFIMDKVKFDYPERPTQYYCLDGTLRLDEERVQKYETEYNKVKHKEKVYKIFSIVLCVLLAIGIAVGGYVGTVDIINKNLSREINGYNASKLTIEQSINNTELSGLERLELVKQAQDKNEWLAKQKVDVHFWGNCYYYKIVVNAIDNMEYINLGESYD